MLDTEGRTEPTSGSTDLPQQAVPDSVTQLVHHSATADHGILTDLYKDSALHLHPDFHFGGTLTTAETQGSPEIPDTSDPPLSDSVFCAGTYSRPVQPAFFTSSPPGTRRAAIRDSALQRLRSILDAIPAFVGLCELTGVMIDVNATVISSTNLPRRYYIGKKIWDLHAFTHSTQSADDMRSNLRAASQGKRVRFQTLARIAGDAYVPVEVTFVPIREACDSRSYVLAFALDISERLEYESRIRETIEHLKQAQHLGQTGSWTWNIKSGDIYWSDETFRLFGMTPQVVEPDFEHHFMGSILPEGRSPARKAIAEAINDPSTPLRMEIRIQSADGQIKDLKAFGVVHCDPRGHPERMTGTAQDVTASRSIEKQRDLLQARLQRASHWASLGEIAGGVAHEINQPLAAIRRYAEGCREGIRDIAPEASVLATQLDEMSRLADRCGLIVKKVKDLAKNRQSRPEKIIVQELFDSVRELLSTETEERRGQITSSCRPQGLCILGDRIQLQQALSNMVRNSLEAFDDNTEDRRIHLKAECEKGHGVVMSVTDWGPGVPQGLSEQIFSPFYTTKPDGMGLGLRVCCKVAEAHGGEFRLRTPPHQGAEFLLSIPAKLPCGKASTADKSPP